MYRIRMVEEEISRRYPEGKMRCPVHLSTGQESIPAAFSLSIKKMISLLVLTVGMLIT